MDSGKVWDALVPVLLAAAGGLARMLSGRDARRARLGRILSELFISGFTGLMAYFAARSAGMTGDWLGLAAGMAGWMGPRALDMMAGRAAKSMGLAEKLGGEPKGKRPK